MTGEPAAGPRKIIGPFTARQLSAIAGSALFAAAALLVLTRPIAPGPDSSATPIPMATPFLVGAARTGPQPGDLAPEFSWTAANGSTSVLQDLQGNPVRLADFRGKLVWLNFWATWCPPCQGETPVLRDMQDKYAAAGLAIVGIAVQETTPSDVAAYAAKYQLSYRIAFDATADVFNLYRVFALPTQVFIGPDGRVDQVVDGPLTDDGASQMIQRWLPSPLPTGSQAPGPT